MVASTRKQWVHHRKCEMVATTSNYYAGPATRRFMAADFPASPDVYEGWNEVERDLTTLFSSHYPRPHPRLNQVEQHSLHRGNRGGEADCCITATPQDEQHQRHKLFFGGV
jgi:hypothetical protein